MAKDKRTSVYFDREKMKFIGLDDVLLKQIKETYDNIDVENELKKMSLWLMSPNGTKRKGEIGFIINWLNNAKPSYYRPVPKEELVESDSSLDPFLREYRKGLWEGREHILAMNRKKS